ncbi:MAG: RiPP maturation radical SAM C-methyltransferase [Elusimicrobia bacterium]|nr:RiPP maturation radical SAM C-methyltransferase [Elusimicrobiota bacterium]
MKGEAALVVPPFASTRLPSLQMGLLKSSVGRTPGMRARVLYANLEGAAHLGWETYEKICAGSVSLIGEWLFSRAAFADDAPPAEQYLQVVRDNLECIQREFGWSAEELVDLRERSIPEFVARWCAGIPWSRYIAVGFTSTFEQNCPALALARKIKEICPRIVTVFGGFNTQDGMGLEYLRAFPWVDYVLRGEAEETFPALLRSLLAGKSTLRLSGLAYLGEDGIPHAEPPVPMPDMETVPEPDYADYFETAQRLDMPVVAGNRRVRLPFEASRGCWWGVKQKCSFCGLNAKMNAYRRKSPARALAELEALSERYGVLDFHAVDTVLDPAYVGDFFGKIMSKDYGFYYAVRPDLARQQLRALAAGGVRILQPGIESLSTHSLRLMRKGSTMLTNLRFLKWAHYYGMTVSWNVLYGLPGETAEDYAAQARLIDRIVHLPPPSQYGRFHLHRFSPYFDEAERSGLRGVRPLVEYSCVYPAGTALPEIAYTFEYELKEDVPAAAAGPLDAGIARWRESWTSGSRPFLQYVRSGRRLTIMDGRRPGSARAIDLRREAADVYEACSLEPSTARQIRAALPAGPGRGLSGESIDKLLAGFAAAGLAVEENGRYLGLALPANRNW